MVVDPKTLNNGIFKYNIGSNVLNKLTGQQAQTPVQQPTNTPITQTRGTQGLQQQPETYKVITNKFPTYDIKDMMGAGSMKNQIGFMQSVGNYNRLQAQANANTDPNVRYNLTKPELTNKQTLQIQQATPETNEQGLKINKTNSFKDLVIDLQNVANQGRNLEFMKFRELYPEYVENWDKVVDLFESIKSNPQYSAEQVTNTAQKAYPELFGIKDNLSDKDKTTALKKLYDEMVSNKQNGIQLTQQDIIDRYPEYANTEDINTVMEVQNLMNRDRKNTPTFNDIYENFESLTKGDVEVGNTEKEQIKKDLANLDKLEARQYNYLSDEGKEYVKLLGAAKAITDELKKNYWIPNDVSERDVLQEVKNKYPDIYSQLTNGVSENVQVSDKDRKLLDGGSTAKSAGKYFKGNLLEFIINTEAGLGDLISTLGNANADFYRDLATALGHGDEWNDEKFREGSTLLGDTLTRAAGWQKEDLESKQRYKEFQEENQKSFKQAMKDGDWTTMIGKSTGLIGQTLPALITSAASGGATGVGFATFLPSSYERALEDLEADESIKLTDNQKRGVALLMGSVESAIEEMSLNMMFPGLKAEGGLAGQVLNKIPGMKNALLRFAVQTELGAASESMEEVAQEFSNNLIARAAGSNRDMGEFSDYWDIFTETFLSSQLISALGGAGEGINQAKINQIQKQITEQADLRNKVLEGQAIMANDFNEFANAVEVVPGTTTEELQQVWNNAQQKKQDLEEKANRITSNSYNNVNVPTYERTTVKDTVKPKITANESQQYTDLLDEMIKNKEISEEDRKRVEKTLGVFTLNTEGEQDNKIGQQTQPSGLANINQNSNTNTEEKSNIISRGQNQLVQNYNRMNPKAINDFKKQFKQDYGKFLVDRGFTKAGESNLEDLVQYADTLLKLKDKALEPMQGRYQDRSLEDMLEMVVDRARNTKDYAKLEEYEKLLQKYNEGGIEVSEILSMMRWFNNKIKTGFFKEQNSEKLELATNVYMATRNFLDKTAKENGMESLDKINREIRAVEHIIGGITYKLQGSSANNMLGLNDYIALGATLVNPEAFAFALTKLALKKESVRNMVLRLAVGKRGNSKNRISETKLNDELNRINAIADQKKRDAAIKDFNEKYGLDGTALPYKEGYNGTPTTTITVTPEGLSKTQGKVNTPNSEQKSQGLSETEKNSEPQDNVNEQVQDSIDDFLSDVGANETKQDLGNATTANYKNMSKRGLEQLLKSDKIPAEEVKKITDELAMRNVKEDKDGWDYLDHKYAYEIQQLQEEEQRIGKVGNKKVNKSYAEEQMKAWEKKKEKLKEDMKQDYGDKDNNRVEDKYGELESKPIDYINEWTKSKKFVVDEAEQQVIKQLQENWNKINRFELNMTEEEKKVREDILGKVSDLYETKSTDYGDSFVSRTNRDNRGIIYRDDGRVNVNSLDTLKSSGLYDVLPDDTKIAISGQEQTTLGELKKQPKGLAEVSNTQAEQEVEGLAKINEKIAQEEQEKLDKENAEKQRLKDNVTRESIRDMDTKDAELDSERSIAEGQRAMLSEQEKAQQYFDKNIKYQKVDQTNTPEFKKWFGDSKVVDEKGKPLVVYHGSKNQFTKFDKNMIRKGATLSANSGDGFYFTDAEGVADKYGKDNYKYAVYLSLKNPLIVEGKNKMSKETEAVLKEFSELMVKRHKDYIDNSFGGYEIFDKNSLGLQEGAQITSNVVNIWGDEFTKFLKEKGYDGIIESTHDRFNKGEKYNYIAFEPEQIKSATDNIGTFDATNPDIRYQRGGSTITPKQVNQLVKQLKKTGLAKDVKVYETQEEFEQAMDAENARLQRAWHGGGDFNRFDLNHVGEGEGNAAHGWGIYVTENKDRASEYGTLYRDNAYGIDTTFGRGTEQFVTYKGKKINEIDGENSSLVRKIIDGMQTKNEAYPYYDAESQIARIRKSINSEQNTWLGKLSASEFAAMKKRNQEKLDFLDSLDPNDFKVENTKRNLYDVEVPDTVKKNTPTGTNYLEEDGMITHEAYTEINDKLSEKIGDKLTRWSNKVTGKVLYERLSEKLGSMKAASEFLKDLGYDGIHYIGELDGSSYVIFDDKALQINDHIKYLKDTHGDIAGAVTPDGTVHLIESNLRGDTATHEFSHLLWSYAKKNNPNLYKALQKIAREAPQELKDYVKRTYGEMSDEAFLDEVFAWKQGKYSGIKTARTWYQRMWDAIKNIWNSIKNSFGSKYADLDVFEAYETMSSEELMDRVDNLLKGGKEIGEGNGVQNYEISNNAVDSQGRKLSPEQQVYFANSKLRNENGELIPVYHGTPNLNINIFDRSKIGTATDDGMFGRGFYFTPDKSYAETYKTRNGKVGEVKEVYLNITNPFVLETQADVNRFNEYYMKYIPKMDVDFIKLDRETRERMIAEGYELGTQELRNAGYDGVIDKLHGEIRQAVVFDSEQIKNIDNYNPTSNPDIRYEKIGGLSNTQIKKFAVQQGLAEISKPQTKEYVVKNGKVGLSNMSIRMQLAEGSFDSYDSMSYENKILSNKSTLQRLADESGVSYKKYEGGYTIDDALKELDDINSNKKGSIKESEIKLAKRDQIKDIIDLIDEGLGGEWNYGWFFDTKREYQWTPTILFRKGNDLANEIANKKTIAFHQPKNRKGYEHVPTRRLPISPTRSKKSK